MKNFELVIPDRLTKKCHSPEETHRWAKRLLIRDIVAADVYYLDEEGVRNALRWRLVKNGLTCPNCGSTQSVIQFINVENECVEHTSCQQCGMVSI